MRVCASCGRENADDSRFCSACGASLSAVEALAEQRKVVALAGRVDEAVAAVEAAIGFHEQKGNVVSGARSRAVLDDLGAARPS